MKKQHLPVIAALIALVVLSFIGQYILAPKLSAAQDSAADQPGVQSLRLTEVMTRNLSALMDSEGKFYDWFEVSNWGTEPVNLRGCTVQRGDDAQKVFVFPAMTLDPGACALVYASGVSRSVAGYALSAGFKLSGSGDLLTLYSPAGETLDQVEIPPLSANQAYRRGADGTWTGSMSYSPGLPNTAENEQLFTLATAPDPLEISEVMAGSVTYLNGADYIEIHNASSAPVSLAGYALTDSYDRLDKYRFPEMTLPADGYLLIRAGSGEGGLTADFRLSRDGEQVLLVNPRGQIVDVAAWDALARDQSLSRNRDSQWVSSLPPTPGEPNNQAGAAVMALTFAQDHPGSGLVINEVMASTTEVVKGSDSYDWVELYNPTAQTIDLSGMGLSDKAGSPRRWQFPQGASIGPGQYLVVYCSGYSFTTADRYGYYHTDFRLSREGGCTLTLCARDGTLIDRVPVPKMYGNISYGRVYGRDGFWYMDMPTPGESNSVYAYSARTGDVEFSCSGGLYDGPVTLELSGPAGSEIYYTLDCTVPDPACTLYTGPIQIGSTTVVRAAAYTPGELPSYVESQTYFVGVSHTVRVVSVVAAPDDLYSEESGILNGSGDDRSTNIWKNWEREAHVELYLTDGTQQLSQGCGIKIHGAMSRELDQRSFKLIARSKYDESNRFRAPIFEGLPFAEYQSVILRSGGQDGVRARMRDPLAAWLAEGAGLLHQDCELCVVYLNGEYYGQYEIRERINLHYLAQHLGIDDTSGISLVKDDSLLAGSNQTYKDLLAWMKKNPGATDEQLAYIATQVDLENYINFSALMVYTGNQDIGLRRYRDANGDGRWRWIVFDFDFAFINDVNSMERWMNPKGAGWYQKADNALFAYCIQNPAFRDRFLTRLGELMSTCWTTDNVLAWIDARRDALAPEMPMMFARWDFGTVKKWESLTQSLRDFVEARAGKLLGYVQEACELTDEEMERYFGNVR